MRGSRKCTRPRRATSGTSAGKRCLDRRGLSCVGVGKRQDMREALAVDKQTVQWHVAKCRKTIEKRVDAWQKSLAQAYETLKARVRACVKHPFHVVKNLFRVARYKGLAKDDAQLNVMFALSDLYMVTGEPRP